MQTINRICISRMKYIGDIVLTTPVLHALREKFPRAHIAYLADKKSITLLEHNPNIDELLPYDFSRPDMFEQLRMMARLRMKKFDVFVDLFSNPRSAMLARASGAPMRIGKDVRGRGSLYTHRMDDAGSLTSAIDYHYHYLKPLGVEPTYRKTEIFLTEDERREARIFLKHQNIDVSKKLVAIHPGATWPNKAWLAGSFAELIDLLRAKLGVEIILSPGPDDAELMNTILKNSSGNVHLLPLLPVRQLAGILSQCNLFVSNDCGPMHIGVAVGTKTIGIFGPEPVEVWFPYSEEDGHKYMFKKIECSPCRVTKCFREGEHFMECMKLITVREVFEEVKKRVVDG